MSANERSTKSKTKLDAKPNDVNWLAPRQHQKKGLVDG
jgi:hypothetical protein